MCVCLVFCFMLTWPPAHQGTSHGDVMRELSVRWKAGQRGGAAAEEQEEGKENDVDGAMRALDLSA